MLWKKKIAGLKYNCHNLRDLSTSESFEIKCWMLLPWRDGKLAAKELDCESVSERHDNWVIGKGRRRTHGSLRRHLVKNEFQPQNFDAVLAVCSTNVWNSSYRSFEGAAPFHVFAHPWSWVFSDGGNHNQISKQTAVVELLTSENHSHPHGRQWRHQQKPKTSSRLALAS